MEKRAICDWLSSTCETEELRFPVLSIYEFICLFVCFRETLSFFFFFYRCSTCASFRKSMSNLFVCRWLLSKLYHVIIVVFRSFYLYLMTAAWFGAHTCWYCIWHLVMMVMMPFKWDSKVLCTLWMTCTFLCTVTPLWFWKVNEYTL